MTDREQTAAYYNEKGLEMPVTYSASSLADIAEPVADRWDACQCPGRWTIRGAEQMELVV